MNIKIICAAISLALASTAEAQTLCVYDVMGANGDIYSLMKDYALAAKSWGADVTLKPYTNEQQAAEDFKAKQCDAVAVSAIRARQFNSFTGSIDAPGALTNLNGAKTLVSWTANPKLAPDMIEGTNEVAGVVLLGPAYFLVKDRNINTLAKAVGKKIGVFDYDLAEPNMAAKVGAEPVSINLLTAGNMFNTGQLDILVMPALAFKPFELFKGLGTQGAIIRFPMMQITGDIIVHQNKFPAGYGQKSRTWFADHVDQEATIVQHNEAAVAPQYWEDIPSKEQLAFNKVIREARIDLTRQAVYNKKAMTIMNRIRCQQDPDGFDCKAGLE